jgi:hypothetical protein
MTDRLVLPWLRVDVFQDGLPTEEPQGCLPDYLVVLDAMWKTAPMWDGLQHLKGHWHCHADSGLSSAIMGCFCNCRVLF